MIPHIYRKPHIRAAYRDEDAIVAVNLTPGKPSARCKKYFRPATPVDSSRQNMTKAAGEIRRLFCQGMLLSVETILDRRRRERGAPPPPAPPHGHAVSWGARNGSNVSRSLSLWAASPPKGSSGPAVDTWWLWPVWNTGCLCGNACCRPCRSKSTRHVQRHQHHFCYYRDYFLSGLNLGGTLLPSSSFSQLGVPSGISGCFTLMSLPLKRGSSLA